MQSSDSSNRILLSAHARPVRLALQASLFFCAVVFAVSSAEDENPDDWTVKCLNGDWFLYYGTAKVQHEVKLEHHNHHLPVSKLKLIRHGKHDQETIQAPAPEEFIILQNHDRWIKAYCYETNACNNTILVSSEQDDKELFERVPSMHRMRAPGANWNGGIAVMYNGAADLQKIMNGMDAGEYSLVLSTDQNVSFPFRWSSDDITTDLVHEPKADAARSESTTGLYQIKAKSSGEISDDSSARPVLVVLCGQADKQLCLDKQAEFTKVTSAIEACEKSWDDEAKYLDVRQEYLNRYLLHVGNEVKH